MKDLKSAKLVCGTCGLPVAGSSPRTDVTRFLAEISRCQCSGVELGSTAVQGPAEAGGDDSIVKVLVTAITCEEASDILGSRYEVLQFLGRGGMGCVFKVRDLELGEIFAVKILNPALAQEAESVKRFEREAKASMQLSNPHLAAAYSYGFGRDNTPYLVMDYLEGQTLEQVLKTSGPLEQARAIDLFIQICEALCEAHSKGVIHRDIKPANIMIMNREGVEFAKLFDFGIAKAMPGLAVDLTSDMTRTGDLFGSPHYMAPEQCRGNPIDQRADIHALGCVMYKVLTGIHPFEGNNILETVAKIITAPATGMAAASNKPISASLNYVVLKCLEKLPEDRYASAESLRADLLKVKEGNPLLLHPTKTSKQQHATAGRSLYQSTWGRRALSTALFVLVLGTLVDCYLYYTGHAPLVRTIEWSNLYTPSTVPASPYDDAERLDSLSYTYFANGDYERAIPLLEFGIKTYKANGSRKVGGGRKDHYLAENISHVGKCYLMLKKYDQAQSSYREALKIFQRWGNYSGGMMTEAVNDYAAVLRGLGRKSDADNMLRDYAINNNLTAIP